VLGTRFAAHIRHEERTLISLIEQSLTDEELSDLLAALKRAE
jgi:hypothetical protein